MKKRIRLTESQLKGMIRKSISKLMTEGYGGYSGTTSITSDVEMPNGDYLENVEFKVTYYHTSAEPETYDYPGCPADDEIEDIEVVDKDLTPEEKDYIQSHWIEENWDELKKVAYDEIASIEGDEGDDFDRWYDDYRDRQLDESIKKSLRKTLRESLSQTQTRNILGVNDDDELNAGCEAEMHEQLESEIWKAFPKGRTSMRELVQFMKSMGFKYDGNNNENESIDFVKDDGTHAYIYPKWYYPEMDRLTIDSINLY